MERVSVSIFTNESPSGLHTCSYRRMRVGTAFGQEVSSFCAKCLFSTTNRLQERKTARVCMRVLSVMAVETNARLSSLTHDAAVHLSDWCILWGKYTKEILELAQNRSHSFQRFMSVDLSEQIGDTWPNGKAVFELRNRFQDQNEKAGLGDTLSVQNRGFLPLRKHVTKKTRVCDGLSAHFGPLDAVGYFQIGEEYPYSSVCKIPIFENSRLSHVRRTKVTDTGPTMGPTRSGVISELWSQVKSVHRLLICGLGNWRHLEPVT